jgi:hypothetical protein
MLQGISANVRFRKISICYYEGLHSWQEPLLFPNGWCLPAIAYIIQFRSMRHEPIDNDRNPSSTFKTTYLLWVDGSVRSYFLKLSTSSGVRFSFLGKIKEATMLDVKINKIINKECSVVKPQSLR